MTTPGGVSNLPPGALTEETLAADTQDMSLGAVRARAAARFSGTYNESTGGNPTVDVAPFGVLTKMVAGSLSSVAQADPADIQGPEDIPDLLTQLILGLPVVGQFFALGQALLGEYEGDDPVLIAIQDLFAPLREWMRLFTGITGRPPTPEEVQDAYNNSLVSVSPGGTIPTGYLPTGVSPSRVDDLEARIAALEGITP
ncbi:hypothetical protein [Mycolicibacterium sp. F2034L]|uniref:hypothetical protein n=1 Tax=Mycolicibacterium sp. F2034L TaxID=2926422 RepID=UPI001FF5EAD8|nr:hypothetical protein [Mycolicibacterium sp. F2034L]MCK0174811.1 hypothetical protein [Mycolicibacterium sp. F2034L]